MRNYLPVLFLIFAHTIYAQSNTRLFDQPMKVKSMSIAVAADVFTATTFIEMEFYNPNNTEEEGLYRFELAKGQAITGFQLELNGRYRDGSIEEKWKARNAYSTIVGKRVDPALLQMDYYNHFSLRIYPLPAKGTRKITMTITQLLPKLGNELQYRLPLAIKDTIENSHINIHVKGEKLNPVIRTGLLYGNKFSNEGLLSQLSLQSKNIQLNGELSFVIPFSAQHPIVCTSFKDGKTYFACRYQPQYQETYRLKPKEISVYWDISANKIRRNPEKEISFLKKLIEMNEVSVVHLYCFNQQPGEEKLFNIPKDTGPLLEYLYNLKYEGATMYENLDLSKVENGSIFIFSDGFNSYGRDEIVGGTRPVFCVTSGEAVNKVFLEKICGTSGGRQLDLLRLSALQAVQESGIAVNKLTRVLSKDKNIFIDKESLVLKDGEMVLTGSMEGTGTELILEFGTTELLAGVNRILVNKNDLCEGSVIHRISALNKYDSMITRADWYTLLKYGKAESIVTLNSSFIVLERIEDYIRFNIRPPKTMEDSCDMQIFVKQDQEKDRIFQKSSEGQVLADVVKSYNKRLADLNPLEEPVVLNNPVRRTEYIGQAQPVRNAPVQPQQAITPLKVAGPVPQMVGLEEVVVVAMGQTRQPKEVGYSVTKIRSHDLSGAHPVYLQQGLTGKVSGLNVQQVNSGVFADSRITLRGIRSLTGNNEPLLVMDDNPIPLRLINSINPNDILDVTILKSPAATAIYGPEGANGAILIRNKKGSRYNSYNSNPYKLKNCDDMDYIEDLKKVYRTEKMKLYAELKNDHGYDPAFYFEVAQHMFESGLVTEAKEILFSAAAISYGHPATIKGIAYVLEYWKQFPDAIKVYEEVLRKDSNNLSSWRDLALAYYQDNNVQQCINLLYRAITHSWPGMDSTHINYKVSMLQEMNAMIGVHRDHLDLSSIEPGLIKPITTDFRITVEANMPGYTRAMLLSAKGKNINGLKSYNIILPQEFQLKETGKTSYKLRVNFYGNYWYESGYGLPNLLKVVVFKGGQKMYVETVLMNNQSGLVDIADISTE